MVQSKFKTLVLWVLLIGVNAMATPLYKKCIVCHGPSGAKKALGVSAIIKDMNKADFITAMKGYQEGSYGKEKKVLMKPQVAKLSDAQIEEIATYITKQ